MNIILGINFSCHNANHFPQNNHLRSSIYVFRKIIDTGAEYFTQR
jgi:hypothetical protein